MVKPSFIYIYPSLHSQPHFIPTLIYTQININKTTLLFKTQTSKKLKKNFPQKNKHKKDKMAFYGDEDEIWKCTTHPSKRRRTGICPLCLKERLSLLCPDCANTRPCPCYNTRTSSSSSASSSFSLQFSDIGRISTLIDHEPAFRRSRSSAFPLFRSVRFSTVDHDDGKKVDGKSSFWSIFWWSKKGRKEKGEPEMRRSRSVVSSAVSVGDVVVKKGVGWYFPSPMKVFHRHSYSKTPKFVHERSPLHRG